MADEMGLGKTVQAAVALSERVRTGNINRALVIVPATLRLNWARELETWAPNLSVGVVQGSARDRNAYYQLPFNVLLASYEQVRADYLQGLTDPHYDVVLLDEAQRIKNPNSETALACRLLRCDAAWALTGTPIENQVGDLVALFRFLSPDLLTIAMSRLEMQSRIQPYFLRRRKVEVLPQLPPIQIQDVPLELEGGQKQAYEQIWASRSSLNAFRGDSQFASSMLALITRLKQACNFDPVTGQSSKLAALNLIVQGLQSKDDKLLVFSQYVEALKWIEVAIADDISVDMLHGELSDRARDRAVQQFNDSPGPRVLLASIRAGGVGLNLGTASHVVLFDRWWNPAVEEQAIHRAHRFGRDRILFVYRFLVVDSIEERIATVLGEKRETFERYIETAESAVMPSFSASDLEAVLDIGSADIGAKR